MMKFFQATRVIWIIYSFCWLKTDSLWLSKKRKIIMAINIRWAIFIHLQRKPNPWHKIACLSQDMRTNNSWVIFTYRECHLLLRSGEVEMRVYKKNHNAFAFHISPFSFPFPFSLCSSSLYLFLVFLFLFPSTDVPSLSFFSSPFPIHCLPPSFFSSVFQFSFLLFPFCHDSCLFPFHPLSNL